MSLYSDPALARLLLIVSVAIAFALYTRLHLVGGGSVSGGYIAILAIAGDWRTILGLAVVTVLTLAIMRGLILRVIALPRSWMFVLSVLVSALLTAALIALLPFLTSASGLSELAIAFGAFVVPGLIAYDMSHQGAGRTLLALGGITTATLAICVPAFLLMSNLPMSVPTTAPFVSHIPTDQMPFAIIAAIVIGAALRFSFDLRSGGFIGALFIVEFFTPEAFLAVGAAAVTTHLLMRAYTRYVVMTPRQQSMGALILGSLVAWASIYWGSALGWVPAMESNAYALSPLLAVGLMAADMGRAHSGVVRTLLGTGLASLGIAAVLWVAQLYGVAAATLLLMASLLLMVRPVIALVRSWQAAEASGLERLGRIRS